VPAGHATASTALVPLPMWGSRLRSPVVRALVRAAPRVRRLSSWIRIPNRACANMPDLCSFSAPGTVVDRRPRGRCAATGRRGTTGDRSTRCGRSSPTPTLKHGGWDLERFWRLGEDEITRVMSTAATLGYPAGNDAALDFGCGVGRLTRAMARHFSHCTGVDVAETMIEQATRLNPGSASTFVVNETNDLARFEDSTFDFVYSALVLQHLPTVAVIRRFIAEFLRVLKPGGLLAFQLPTRMPPRSLRNRLRLRTRAYTALRAVGFDQRMLYERLKLVPVMQMQCIPEEAVLAYLRLLGAAVLEVQHGRFEVGEVESAIYFVTKSSGR
jgi:ubiquinone/menaquinone biosynthesis C-methylase UbiE